MSEANMSAIALNLPKPLRPWMVWTMACILTLIVMVAVFTPRAMQMIPVAERSQGSTYLDKQAASAAAEPLDRKIIRTSALELTVLSPAQTAEQIRLIAENLGGYLENGETRGQDAPYSSLTIRVPSAQLEQAKAEIRKLAVQVDNEKTESTDATKQYVDMQARLRNLRAEEAQYLQIMKSAFKVDDMLNVTAKLSEVRGQIAQQQAEFEALSKQVEMAVISVALHTQVEAQVMGINWRPLYQLKLAARDGLSAIASYTSTMLSVIFILPAMLLWVGTILLGVVLGWRIMRWAARFFFVFPKAVTTEKGEN